MENLTHNHDSHSIIEDDFSDFSYSEPETQNESISEDDYYTDAYNFYPDAGF